MGTEFSSSFQADGTDFDEGMVSRIEQGGCTKAAVIALLGPAGGDYMAPLTANPRDRALVYLYSQTRGSASDLRVYMKTLVVSYDASSGLITHVDYRADGNKD